MSYWDWFKNICTVIVIIEIWCVLAGYFGYRLCRFLREENEA